MIKGHTSQSPFVHHRVDSHPLVLLVVRDKVLDDGPNTLFLKSVDVGRRKDTREERVFREGLERPSTERRALYVGRGSEEET